MVSTGEMELRDPSTCDRMIGDRRIRNWQEGRIPGVSRALPTASQLSVLEVAPSLETVRICISDRRDFYHQFPMGFGPFFVSKMFASCMHLLGFRPERAGQSTFGLSMATSLVRLAKMRLLRMGRSRPVLPRSPKLIT